MNFGELNAKDILTMIKAMKTVEDCNRVEGQVNLYCKINKESKNNKVLRNQFDDHSVPILEKAGELELTRIDAQEAVDKCRDNLDGKDDEEIIEVLRKCRERLSTHKKAHIQKMWDAYNQLSHNYHPMYRDKRSLLDSAA